MTPARPADRPRIGNGFRLQWEPAQSCHVLLYPEGMVKLNGSAGEIMKRCDGERSIQAIVEDLESAFSQQGLERDVLAFVDIAAEQRWLVWDAAWPAERRAAPKPAGIPSGDRPAYPADEGSS